MCLCPKNSSKQILKSKCSALIVIPKVNTLGKWNRCNLLSRHFHNSKYVFIELKTQKKSKEHNIQVDSSMLQWLRKKPIPLQEDKPNLLEKLINISPSTIQPYLHLARINKPTGTILLLWPCFWSIALTAETGCFPSLYYLSLFGLGAFLMRGAGCTINDMWDKDLDSKVKRTKNRPLASGIIDKDDALAFLAIQLSFSSLILLQLNWYSILLGASSMALVVTYPLAKRFTNWPQLVLGCTFNWGSLLGWAAVKGSCDWFLILPLYLAGVSWTLVYDTIYAHQDKTDDVKVGIKSTALMFGNDTKKWLTFFSSSMVANLLVLGYLNDQTWPYFLSVAAVSGHLATQITTLKLDSPEDCYKKFKSNCSLGLVLFLGIVVGTLLKDKKYDSQDTKSEM